MLRRTVSLRDLILAAKPVAYWPMNDRASGLIADVSGRGHHGTLTGNLYHDEEKIYVGLGAGVKFGGTGTDYVSIPTAVELNGITGDVTYECWLITGGTSYQMLMSACNDGSNAGYVMYFVNATGNIEIEREAQVGLGQSTSPIPVDGKWHHIAFTRSGSTYVIYIDGLAVTAFTNATAIGASTAAFRLGSSSSYAADPFLGSMSNAAVYNRALEPSEILARYKAGLYGPFAGLTLEVARTPPASGSISLPFIPDTSQVYQARLAPASTVGTIIGQGGSISAG